MVDIGEGLPLVILHGFCETPAIFNGILPELSQECRVIAPTLPGHGGTPWDPSIRSLDDIACWLRDILDAMGIERCVLVGHSMGGYIAAAFADLFSERLAGLGFLHSTAMDDAEERKPNRTKAIGFVKDHGREPFLRAFVDSLFHDPEAQWVAELAEITSGTSEEAILALLRIMRDRPDKRAAVRGLAVPVMYIIGGKDGLVSPERSRMELQELPLALLHRIPEASHMGMYEAPGRVVAAVRSLVELGGRYLVEAELYH
ncbi:MAG: alpha/beta fold hydrolase [Bacteroidia bacterium]